MSQSPSIRRSCTRALGILSLGAIALTGSTGCQTDINGQTLPSANYLSDDVQYFAPGLEFKLSREAAALREARIAAETPAPAPLVAPGMVPGAMPPGMVPGGMQPGMVPAVPGGPIPMAPMGVPPAPVPMPPGVGPPFPGAGGFGR